MVAPECSDALVFFGATGDLACKKIFPALQGLIRGGQLDIPIIGVARAGWALDKLRERARDGSGASRALIARRHISLIDASIMVPALCPRLFAARRLREAGLVRKRIGVCGFYVQARSR
jgi:hypothetical protein